MRIFVRSFLIERMYIMLQLTNFSMYHLRDLAELIKDLNVVINSGEKVAIIGDEGTGKSTLLRYLNGDNEINQFVSVKGDYANRFKKIVYLPQILPLEFEEYTINNFIYKDEDPNLMRYDLLYKVAGELSFPQDKIHSDQLMSTLSGGEKIKIQLVKMLMQDPDLLLLDEPTNDLDIQTIHWLENFIKNSSLTIVFVSHDETLLTKAATKVIHLELLQHRKTPRSTVANLPYKEYIEQREKSFEHQMAVAKDQRIEYQKQVNKHRQIEQRVHHELGKAGDAGSGRLLKKKMASIKATGKRFERERDNFEEIPITSDPILIKFSNVQPFTSNKTLIHWKDKKVQIENQELVEGIDLHIRTGEKIGIVGANGVGKSTLLHEIWQELKNREDIKVGYMPQNYTENMNLEQTPIEFMTETGEKDERTQIMTYLGSLRYTQEEMHHNLRQLSGGQLAKLWLAKLDIIGANVLLLDEPTRNFSPLSQPELLELFQNFEGSIISVSHDRNYLNYVCSNIYQLTSDSISVIKL